MSAVVMDGKALAAKVKEQVRQKAEKLDRTPGLAVIIVGDNPASRVYVNGKKKDCEECGFYSEEHALPGTATQEELLELIATLNEREDIDGILVQLPLPQQFNEQEVLRAIRTDKDVDCFHPYNVGKLMIGETGFLPCTPAGVMRMLEEYGVDVAGKHCVVVGRSNIVGLTVLVAVLLLVLLLWYRPIMWASFDREYARSQGVKADAVLMLMTILTAVTIVLSIRIVGIVLLISLLTVPTVIASALTKSYSRIMILSSLLAVAGNIVGLWVAYEVDFPVGATTIILLGITLFIVKLLTLPSRRKTLRAKHQK